VIEILSHVAALATTAALMWIVWIALLAIWRAIW